ncbi:MAG TPA: hypothetical protein VE619_08440 [Nitrososphaeraceae archaeon]|nr:hypothetical protein [Nitrososphaeraceae archaeon]
MTGVSSLPTTRTIATVTGQQQQQHISSVAAATANNSTSADGARIAMTGQIR